MNIQDQRPSGSAWLERVPMLSINPDAATRDDVANLAAHLMESRCLLCLVWNHMHGQNLDGSRRPWPGDDGCAVNWNKLSDAIGAYLDTPNIPGERPGEPPKTL